MKKQLLSQSEIIVHPVSVHLSGEQAAMIRCAMESDADLVMRIKSADKESSVPISYKEMLVWVRSMEQQ